MKRRSADKAYSWTISHSNNDQEGIDFSNMEDEGSIGGEPGGVGQAALEGDLPGRPARIQVTERKKRNGAYRLLQLYQQRDTMARKEFIAAARRVSEGKEVEGIALMEDVVRTARAEVPREPVDEARTFIPPRPARPASDEVIASIPRRKYVEDEGTEEAESTCAICLVDCEDEELLLVLKCGHLYHGECAEQWLKQRRTCPTCRAFVKRVKRRVEA